MLAIRRRNHETRDRSDPGMVRCFESEASHEPGQMGRLSVIAPAHRIAVHEGEQGGHIAALDAFRHVAAVVRSSASGPLRFAFDSVCLHAVAALPGGIVSKRNIVEETLVFPPCVGGDVPHLDLSYLGQALELSSCDRIYG